MLGTRKPVPGERAWLGRGRRGQGIVSVENLDDLAIGTDCSA